MLLSGAYLGGRRGAGAQLGYIALGAVGLPLFSGGATGLAYLAGPTAGYLFGFAAASLFVGEALRRPVPRTAALFFIFVVADCIILGSGALWLMATGVPYPSALALGVLPFVPGDLVKICAAVAVYRTVKFANGKLAK